MHQFVFPDTERLGEGDARVAFKLSSNIAVDLVLMVIDRKGVSGGNDVAVSNPLNEVIVCTGNGNRDRIICLVYYNI